MLSKLTYESKMFSSRHAPSTDMDAAHFHNTYEIYYLLSGKRRYFISYNIYELRPGDLILIPPRMVHKVMKSPCTEEGEYHDRYLLSFTEASLSEDLKRCFLQNHYRLDTQDNLYVRQLFERIRFETEHYDNHYLQMFNTYLTQMLVMLSRKYYSESIRPVKSEKRIDSIIEKITSYIYENQSHDISLSAIAENFGITKEYLSSEFKKSIGCGFSEFVTTTRIATSVRLLTTTDMPIKRIAPACGYKDSNYFAAAFKRAMGVTPTEYRNSAQSNIGI